MGEKKFNSGHAFIRDTFKRVILHSVTNLTDIFSFSIKIRLHQDQKGKSLRVTKSGSADESKKQ